MSPLSWYGTGKKISLECAGRNQTILTWPVGVIGILPDSYSRIAHCDLQGPGVPEIGGPMLIFSQKATIDVTVEDNIIERAADAGINTGGDSRSWTIRNNLFRSNGGDGIFLASGTNNSVVADNVIIENGKNGIDCNCSDTAIHGNISRHNGIAKGPIDISGILVSGILNGRSANFNSVVGNETSYNNGVGIIIRADLGTFANYNVVSGNVSHDNGADGIDIDGSDLGTWIGNTIVGNTVYHNTRFGIMVDGQNASSIQHTLISSNTSIANGSAGIYLYGSNTTDTLVVHNSAVQNGGVQISNNSTTRTLLAGNKENSSDSSYVIEGDLVANTVTSQGLNPIRLPNSAYIVAQGAGTTSESLLIGLDGANQTIIRGGGGPRSLFIQTSLGAEGASMTDFGLWNFPGGLNIGSGISSDGSGLKHQSVSTGSIHSSSSALVTLAWATPFADANYDPQCSVRDLATGIGGIRIHHIQSFGATGVTVLVVNDDPRLSHVGTLYCLGMHQMK
jgi:parallel beta-helix repeat protein